MTELVAARPPGLDTPGPPGPESSDPGWASGPRRVLVAVDSTSASRWVLATAIATALEGHNVLTILSAAPAQGTPVWAGMGYAMAVNQRQIRLDAVETAERNLAWARDMVPCGILATTRVVTDVGGRRALLREARSRRHHVIVVAAPASGVIRRLVAAWHRWRLSRCGVGVVVA